MIVIVKPIEMSQAALELSYSFSKTVGEDRLAILIIFGFVLNILKITYERLR
jgi:hypothetical protein